MEQDIRKTDNCQSQRRNYAQRTINILEVYAQDQVSDGRPFPSGTQSTQDLQPHFTANFT